MRPKGPWKRSLSVIDRIYKRNARVTYKEFLKQWFVGRPPKGGVPQPPSQQTYSRIWNKYQEQHRLKTIRDKQLTEWMSTQFRERNLDPALSPIELESLAVALMIKRGLVMPSPYRFERSLRAALKGFKQNESEDRLIRIQKSLGVSLRELPISERWIAARELLRYPPADIGKANLKKMAVEFQIFKELSKTLANNELNPQLLLKQPDCERLFQFVERRRPSLLAKWEQRKVLEALPFYLAVRLTKSIDAVLLCFVRKARLLHSRIHEDVEESRREESLALLERSGKHLQSLQKAISEALAKGTPEPLKPFQKKLSNLYKDRAATLDRNRLYQIIGSMGTYTRKLSRRLVEIPFEGQEAHAKALVSVLSEVFQFASFKEEVPDKWINQLTFLEVPPQLLAQRQVFESAVLITLADYLGSGRVTVSLSRRFPSIWASVPSSETRIDSTEWIRNRQQKMGQNWTTFEQVKKKQTLVKDGRLYIRRSRPLMSQKEERYLEEQHQTCVSKLKKKKVAIAEVILRVHHSTGLLNEFQLPKRAPHQLAEEERIRLTTVVLLAMGMNIGIRDIPTVFGIEYQVGRIQHFVDCYMTKENFEHALSCILNKWDEREYGSQWGSGHRISVDGRVVGAYENNLLSQYHYRRGRIGMTVYWFSRDDGVATRVKTLGNQEWESWHVLDELLHPLTDRELQSSCGDTQGQFLALWGLAELVGKEIEARFRRPSRVLLYKPTTRNRAGLKKLRAVKWDIIEQNLPSMMRLAAAVSNGEIDAVDIFRRWNLYDEDGNNVAAGLRELGKVNRTEFLLRYAQDMDMQRRIQKACNQSESWNSFHNAIFWGNGGILRSNDPARQEEYLLALTLLMDSIVFYNVEVHGDELKRSNALTPVIWEHVKLFGEYQIESEWFSGEFQGVKKIKR